MGENQGGGLVAKRIGESWTGTAARSALMNVGCRRS